MTSHSNIEQEFHVMDCALVAIATGRRAHNLSYKELRRYLLTIHPGNLYQHYRGALPRPRF